MIFIDSENLKGVRKFLHQENRGDRWIDFFKLNSFVLDYLGKNIQYKHCKLHHIRTYYYTGEYTPQLMKRIKEAIDDSEGDKKTRFQEELQKAEENLQSQKRFFKETDGYYFFEVRKKPLQFRIEQGIFQKGVDVQIAVDLVSNAHMNTYDIAVLFSGDIDLIESVRTVKNLGKQVIIFSHFKNTAQEMKKYADAFFDFQKMTGEQLDQCSHVFERKKGSSKIPHPST